MAKPSLTGPSGLLFLILIAGGAEWVRAQGVGYPWLTQQGSTNPDGVDDERVRAIRPEVHTVKADGETIEVRSAGISLHYFGPLQTPVDQVERPRRLRFRIPALPVLNDGPLVRVRPGVGGLFVNGIPIYDQNRQRSYRGQNIWHFDMLAINDDGSLVARGRPRDELTHASSPGLLAPLITGNGGHSPIIGYAFDGYPIYGPWGYARPDGPAASGGLQRMSSGYRLRQITTRETLPDGTRLTPGQYGPAVGKDFPLGSFIEDYHFSPEANDLDRFNGRWTVTPDHPQGTYAYFLTTDEAGRLAFPYLLGEYYRGKVARDRLAEASLDEAGQAEPAVLRQGEQTIPPLKPAGGYRLILRTRREDLIAGRPVRLSFEAQFPDGRPIRFLEHVHERPLHLLVVSEDLTEFDHLHPEPAAGDRYEIVHRFGNGRRYRLYADYTPPGGTQQIVSYLLRITGGSVELGSSAPRLTKAGPVEREQSGLRLRLAPRGELRAGEETDFQFQLRDRTEQLPTGLEPFLGAWAHFVVIDPAHQHFIHAHPIDAGSPTPAESLAHAHLAVEPGPPPEVIQTRIIFPQPGLYRIWAQFQIEGRLITAPFDVQVGAAVANFSPRPSLIKPPGSINIRVGREGFVPAEIRVPSGEPIRLAIERLREPNCASQILFPALGLRRQLPLGETTIIELPPSSAGSLSFSCGMGMYRGLIIAAPPERPRKAK